MNIFSSINMVLVTEIWSFKDIPWFFLLNSEYLIECDIAQLEKSRPKQNVYKWTQMNTQYWFEILLQLLSLGNILSIHWISLNHLNHVDCRQMWLWLNPWFVLYKFKDKMIIFWLHSYFVIFFFLALQTHYIH